LLLYVLQAVLAVVLLLNISVNPTYLAIPNTELKGWRGVSPFNKSRLEDYSNSWLQGKSLTGFGASYGHSLSNKPFLTQLGRFVGADCPTETSCFHMFLSQGVQHINDPRLIPTYVKIFQVPIFQITLSAYFFDQIHFDSAECRQYGYTGSSVIICAKDLSIHNQNNTSVLIGE
jgi:hypothetical protein